MGYHKTKHHFVKMMAKQDKKLLFCTAYVIIIGKMSKNIFLY